MLRRIVPGYLQPGPGRDRGRARARPLGSSGRRPLSVAVDRRAPRGCLEPRPATTQPDARTAPAEILLILASRRSRPAAASDSQLLHVVADPGVAAHYFADDRALDRADGSSLVTFCLSGGAAFRAVV
jgi:hypothetical protein